MTAIFAIHLLRMVSRAFWRLRRKDTLTSNLQSIFKRMRSKKQCCLLTHKRCNNIGPSVVMDAVNINESDALEVLGIKIQYDIR